MKFIAVLMLFASALFFAVGEPEAFIPGAAFFGSGLWLLTRRQRIEALPAPPEMDSRLRSLESELLLLNQELARTREDVADLAAERDFLRQLYAGGKTASKTVGFPSV